MSAAINAAIANVPVVVIAGPNMGHLGHSPMVMNIPGFQKETGTEILNKMRNHAQDLGAQFIEGEVVGVSFDTKPAMLWVRLSGSMSPGSMPQITLVKAHSVVLCTGGEPRKLSVSDHRAVYHCSMCDSLVLKQAGVDTVVVVGGGDAAVANALHLSTMFPKVICLTRSGWKTKDKARLERLHSLVQSGKVHWQDRVEVSDLAVHPSGSYVTAVRLKTPNGVSDIKSNKIGVFCCIGSVPRSKMFADYLKTDESGYIVVDAKQRVAPSDYYRRINVPMDNIFAAGEVADPHYRLAATSMGQAFVASNSAVRYLENLPAPHPGAQSQPYSQSQSRPQPQSQPGAFYPGAPKVMLVLPGCHACEDAKRRIKTNYVTFNALEALNRPDLFPVQQIKSAPTFLVLDKGTYRRVEESQFL